MQIIRICFRYTTVLRGATAGCKGNLKNRASAANRTTGEPKVRQMKVHGHWPLNYLVLQFRTFLHRQMIRPVFFSKIFVKNSLEFWRKTKLDAFFNSRTLLIRAAIFCYPFSVSCDIYV